jgi:hypothetical protein
MIPGLGQLREVRAHGPIGDLAVPGDDGCPIARWDLDCLKDLGLTLAAQLSLARRSQVADPLGLPIWRNQVAATANLDRNHRNLVGLSSELSPGTWCTAVPVPSVAS